MKVFQHEWFALCSISRWAGYEQHTLQKADSSPLDPPADICLQHRVAMCS